MPSTSQTQDRVRLFRAPGRVNLIGEHTDYNDGYVMPVAINFSTWIELKSLADRKLVVNSQNTEASVEFDLDHLPSSNSGNWSDYVVGVAVVLKNSGVRLQGARLKIRGEVPIGAGLSSSAALEVATALALTANSNVEIDRRELAGICQRAENEFVGAHVGIMDQFVSLNGLKNHALLLDCRSLDFTHLPLSDKALLVVCNTMVKHELAASEYNERRKQCEVGVEFLAHRIENVRALRDIGEEQLASFSSQMPDEIFRRCRHVVTENSRVLKAAEALRDGNLSFFGELMYESHQSLKDDYEVSCSELDLMVEIARRQRGVYGARMTGGGFGGCTINVVAAEHIAAFKSEIESNYERTVGLKPEIYVCEAADAAEEVKNRKLN